MESLADLGVLIVHGMGRTSRDYANDFRTRIRRELGADSPRVALEPCYWGDILEWHQDRVRERVERTSALGYRGGRAWVLTAFGDPVGYLSGYLERDAKAYSLIHDRVRDALGTLATQLRDPDAAPLFILAYSLGSVIASNYIWDEQKATNALTVSGHALRSNPGPAYRGRGRTAFEQCRTLAGLITYGSNIPLFLPPVPRIEGIVIPGPDVPGHLRPRCRWLNIYSRFDLLGYPLANLWDDAKGTIYEDVAMSVGGLLAPWPVTAHTRYEKSGRFVRRVAAELRRVLPPTIPPGPY